MGVYMHDKPNDANVATLHEMRHNICEPPGRDPGSYVDGRHDPAGEVPAGRLISGFLIDTNPALTTKRDMIVTLRHVIVTLVAT